MNRRLLPALAAALVAVALLGSWTGAAGQVPTLPPLGPTTTAPGQTTTTTTAITLLPPGGGGSGQSTTTTQPPSTTPPPSQPTPAPGPSAPPPTGAPPPGAPGSLLPGPALGPEVLGPPPPLAVVPPWAQAQIDSVRRSGPTDTAALLEALRPLEDLGFTPAQAALMGFGHLPVAGYASWTHDWLYPRFVPVFHLHEGTDVFAAAGTPVRAPFAGTARLVQGAVSGLAAYVVLPDQTYVFMGHLQSFAPGLSDGQAVEQGQPIGAVGDTGNAVGTSPHVHFEYHPKGGPPTDPKALLDQWVQEAVAAAPALVAHQQRGIPRVLLAVSLVRRLEGDAAPTSAPTLLWASSVSPAGGPLQLAEAQAIGVARRVDWEARARREQARAAELVEARRRGRALLLPVTPPGLAGLLGDPAS